MYHQDIFDVLMDWYEEEYLLRFARPRHGDVESAPNIEDLRQFWRGLHTQEYLQKRVFLPMGGAYKHSQGVRCLIKRVWQKILGCVRLLTGSEG